MFLLVLTLAKMRALAHIFSILAFVLSSLLTIQLLISRAEDWLACVTMTLLGLVSEGGKGLLFYHGVDRPTNTAG